MSLISGSIQFVYDALLFNKHIVTKRFKCIPFFRVLYCHVIFLVFISAQTFSGLFFTKRYRILNISFLIKTIYLICSNKIVKFYSFIDCESYIRPSSQKRPKLVFYVRLLGTIFYLRLRILFLFISCTG